MATPLLGCIADDFTGGTDLASTLVAQGMRTVQVLGVPDRPLPSDADAVVVALKTRTLPAAEAVAQSLAALAYLRELGCRQFFFKYCSTFDSTAAGNIGPVADALAEALGARLSIACPACPAFPENGRTLYLGQLFVGDQPLAESGMRHHPLTPMTDSNLVRVLQAQTSHSVGLLRLPQVRQGSAAIATALADLQAQGVRHVIVDAIDNADLHAIGAAVADHPLVTGGSGVALGLPANFRRRGLLAAHAEASALPAAPGLAAVLSGSCSTATRGQVALWLEHRPGFRLDPLALAAGEDQVGAALEWAAARLPSEPVLIYGSADPAEVRKAQAQLGVERAGQLVEDALARIAQGLHEVGVTRLVVAGGETSGAVVKALAIDSLRIGAPIAPGVPWTLGSGARGAIALALKSGNFGTPDFFERALAVAP
ncbi:3-oxo-tetronate kinase [Pseudomonas sp. LA5]|uniref:3-oxo-tetronate kinase n=1 Tax=Pseudomonas sp. LA5 TaxID=3027850 RepID=UPI002361E531|nr:3-oxo-tetronate kinase [Pseudomonas sp. LA5]